MATFSNRLRKARIDKGMTQTDLGEVCRDRYGNPATHSTISQYEKGLTTPTVENLMAMARALEVSIDWLLGNSGTFVGRSLSPDAIRLAKEFDALPKQAQETIVRCMSWTHRMSKKRIITASDLVQAILADTTIPR